MLLLVLGLELAFSSSVSAKKLLPFLTKSTKTTSSTSGKVSTAVKFRGDRLGIIINFNNLQAARKADYFLSYQTRGTTQGASGSITNTSMGSTSRDIIFGSCSHGVCRFDSGISNAKLVITIYLNSGRKIVRSYKLKV